MTTATSTITSTAGDRLLSETEAALHLGCSIRTLQSWRLRGGGPRYSKVGRLVRYRPTDLSAFVDAGARRHTSEDAR